MLPHVAASRRQIAPKEAGRPQGGGQPFGIGQVPAMRGLGASEAQKIVEEIVHCHGLLCHGSVGVRVVEDLKPSCSLPEQTFFAPRHYSATWVRLFSTQTAAPGK